MSLLEITNLSHSFSENVLYKNADFSLNKEEHVGIVGQNGTGKSTLIKLCTGQLLPDDGRVTWQSKTSIGYLDQYAEINLQLDMKSFLKTAFLNLYDLEEKMNYLYENMQEGDFQNLNTAARYQEELERQDFYLIDTKIEQVATGLGLLAIGLDRPIAQMSGGQRAKVILAKLLLEKPDVLLLDEPTNFLDKEHVDWLSEYLCGLNNAFMVVSHDYAFLEKISNRICDIDNHKITKYYGTYSEFLRKKTALREDYIRQYSAQQKEIKKTEEFIRKNIAGRKSKMARGRQKQLDRMDKMEAIDQKEIIPFFHFREMPLTNTEHLNVKHLSVGYHYPVLSDINFTVNGGQKVVITGFNGIGKSTLLREYLPQYFESYLYINQKPLLGNKNSCVATVLDISNKISELYAKKHKKDKKFFSNLTGNDGMCPVCAGAGYIEYGDDYHQSMRIECRECEGTGFNKILKKYKIKGASIFDVWKMTLDEAADFFGDTDKSIAKVCVTASEIMLGHLHVGQATGTLSGGENIRIKIMKASKSTAKVIGVDEPFKGLSNIEIDAVARYLDKIREKEKTLVVIDHTTGVEDYFSQWIQIENRNNVLSGKILK